jgi:hypothetical protein
MFCIYELGAFDLNGQRRWNVGKVLTGLARLEIGSRPQATFLHWPSPPSKSLSRAPVLAQWGLHDIPARHPPVQQTSWPSTHVAHMSSCPLVSPTNYRHHSHLVVEQCSTPSLKGKSPFPSPSPSGRAWACKHIHAVLAATGESCTAPRVPKQPPPPMRISVSQCPHPFPTLKLVPRPVPPSIRRASVCPASTTALSAAVFVCHVAPCWSPAPSKSSTARGPEAAHLFSGRPLQASLRWAVSPWIAVLGEPPPSHCPKLGAPQHRLPSRPDAPPPCATASLIAAGQPPRKHSPISIWIDQAQWLLGQPMAAHWNSGLFLFLGIFHSISDSSADLAKFVWNSNELRIWPNLLC